MQPDAESPAFAHSEPRQAAGDLAAEVNAHLDACIVCRRSFFTTDDVTPCCRIGADLKRRYREARRKTLGEP